MATYPDISSHSLLHTKDHLNCPACTYYLDRVREPVVLGRMKFKEAAPIWLREHKEAIAAKTHSDYEYYIRMLDKFFGELRLNEIHAGHLQAYVAERLETAGASCINHELNTVKQILEMARTRLEA